MALHLRLQGQRRHFVSRYSTWSARHFHDGRLISGQADAVKRLIISKYFVVSDGKRSERKPSIYRDLTVLRIIPNDGMSVTPKRQAGGSTPLKGARRARLPRRACSSYPPAFLPAPRLTSERKWGILRAPKAIRSGIEVVITDMTRNHDAP